MESLTANDVVKQILKMDKFNGAIARYQLWKMKLMALLKAKCLLDVVEQSIKSIPKTRFSITPNVNISFNDDDALTDLAAGIPISKSDKKVIVEQERRSAEAYFYIISQLTEEVAITFADIPSGNAYELWKALNCRYERKTTASKVHIRSMLHKCKMNESEEFDTFASRIKQFVIRLQEMKEQVSESEMLFVLYEGLPKIYEPVIEPMKLNNDIKFDDACEHIRDKQEQIKFKQSVSGQSTDNIEQANYVNANSKLKLFTCRTCDKPGHVAFHCPRNRRKKKCDYCRSIGHTEGNCYYKLNKKGNASDTEFESDDGDGKNVERAGLAIVDDRDNERDICDTSFLNY
jgi:hypothetical protein